MRLLLVQYIVSGVLAHRVSDSAGFGTRYCRVTNNFQYHCECKSLNSDPMVERGYQGFIAHFVSECENLQVMIDDNSN